MHTDNETQVPLPGPRSRTRSVTFVVVTAVIIAAFFGAYAYAASSPVPGDAACPSPGLGSPESAAAACGDGCCGAGASGPVTTGEATVEGDVQRVFVDVSKGYFDPGEIVLSAGVPTEITFSEGQGCLAQVMFEQFGIVEDLTSGGAVVELPALDPGTYEFSCGMRMVFGTLVVR